MRTAAGDASSGRVPERSATSDRSEATSSATCAGEKHGGRAGGFGDTQRAPSLAQGDIAKLEEEPPGAVEKPT